MMMDGEGGSSPEPIDDAPVPQYSQQVLLDGLNSGRGECPRTSNVISCPGYLGNEEGRGDPCFFVVVGCYNIGISPFSAPRDSSSTFFSLHPIVLSFFLFEIQVILSFVFTDLFPPNPCRSPLLFVNMHSFTLYSAAAVAFAALASGHGVILGAQGEKGSPASVGFQGTSSNHISTGCRC